MVFVKRLMSSSLTCVFSSCSVAVLAGIVTAADTWVTETGVDDSYCLAVLKVEKKNAAAGANLSWALER